MKKGKIYIDSDGFFWPSDISNEYMKEQRKGITFDKDEQHSQELFEQYYLGFRSSFFICEDELDAETGMKLLKEWRETCVLMAKDYYLKHFEPDFSLPIDFLWITRMEIIDSIKDEYPNIDDLQLKLAMKPRISAYVKDKNNIVFPALVRSVLNQCNLVLINHAFEIIDSEFINHIDRRYISRFILPYLIFCHDNFSVKNLPVIGGYSEQAITTTLNYTNIQVTYILAHEYAHILLKHYSNDVIASKSSEEIENEADELALKVLLKCIENNKKYSKDDVFTAIRWLFKYQLLEESVGMLVRGEPLNYTFSNYEKRRGTFQSELIKKCNITGTSLIDMIGFASIVELQNVLFESGTNLIETIIQAFKNSQNKGDVEPWWETITQK